MVYVIQVREGGRWVDWNEAGGGDYIEFSSYTAARKAALATGELVPAADGKTWRVHARDLQQNPRRRLSKKCQRIVSRTAAQEIHAGYPRAQAVAIGYSKAREAGCRVPSPKREELQDNPTAFWGKYLG